MLLARRELLRRQRELERRRRAERARQQAYVIATRAVRRWLRWRFLQKVRRCVHLHLARHRLLQRSMQTVASAVARPPVREAVACRGRAACAGASMREAVAVAAERERVAEEQRRWEEELRRQIAAAIEAAKARVATPLQTRFRARSARRRYVAMRAAAVRIAGWRRRLVRRARVYSWPAGARRPFQREEERQRRALQVIWKVVVPWLARRALRFKPERRLAVLRGMIRVKAAARGGRRSAFFGADLAGERAPMSQGRATGRRRRPLASRRPWRSTPSRSVWKSNFTARRAESPRLHAIDATPARWRGGAGSSLLDGASTAASSPRNDVVKNYRVHPTHWLISTQVTVWKQTQELDRRLNMLMIARAQRAAARAAKRVREIDLSGVPKFCRTLPRRFALKRFEDERLQILQRSTQRVAFLRQLAARARSRPRPRPRPFSSRGGRSRGNGRKRRSRNRPRRPRDERRGCCPPCGGGASRPGARGRRRRRRPPPPPC